MLKRKKRPAKFKGLEFGPKYARRTSERSTLIKQCDELLSRIVRIEDKCCLYCRRVWDFKKLYNHHIFSRKNMGTRFYRPGCICLCFSCHDGVAHTDPEIFRDWLIKRIGQKEYDLLKFKAMSRTKFTVADLRMIKFDLQKQLKRLT
jgi:5-methylcytosine-specific restriction endonuclease McrA